MNKNPPKVYIKLVELGNRKQDVLYVLARIQGLKDTPEQLVAHIPCYISDQVSSSLAQKVKMYLEKAGATVVLDAELPDRSDESEDHSWTAFDSPGYDLTSVETAETSLTDVVPFETEAVEATDIPIVYPDMLEKPAFEQSSSHRKRSFQQDRYAERLTQVVDVSEPASPKRRSKSARRTSSRALKTVSIVLLFILVLGAVAWLLLSGQFDRITQTYQQNPVVGQVGVLEVTNAEQAELRLYHIIGTRVTEPIPLEGEETRLKQGDYYLEARKGSQTLQFPVYIQGRGHRLKLDVEFPVKSSPSKNVAYIPSGWFRMGNKETSVAHFGFPDEKPDIDVYVSGFFLSRYEVTNREFLQFLKTGGYENEIYWERLLKDWPSLVEQIPSYLRVYGNDGWKSVKAYIHARFIDTDDRPGPRLWEDRSSPYGYGQEEHPVTGVSLYEAEAYCQWMTQQTGMIHRLPTEAEWEKAARGYEGYFFSYGNEYDPTRANTEVGNTRPIGSYPPNSYGLYDMTGSVWEWVRDQYRANAYQLLLEKYQTEIRNPLTFDESMRYDRGVVRGGSYRSVNRVNARTPVRYPMFPNDWHTNIGFRYVVVP
ncbi:hypothetical protein U27_05568 [Candidatus Vecturithrix granuli]|uniref:Sulfatase-modifying factor enzyme-like domain-containing protein n=1 Tax=Vecturithrix granuli TaxID=1499967 RepID=A0A081C1Y9_VECG1|nr:hypothetical protein U27_05568 [Candidatus Vecturithrix granuli]